MGRLTVLSSSSQRFSARLAGRILAFTGVASLAAAHASCSGGGAGGSGITTTMSGTGGVATTMGAGAGGSSSSGLGDFDGGITDGVLGPPPPGMACFDWPADAGDCPTSEIVVIFQLDKDGCADGGAATQEASGLISGPTHNETDQCCYYVNFQWCIGGGRPYLVGDRAQVASVERGERGAAAALSGWSAGERPCLDGLDAADRAALAAAWTADALLEHGSVASFSRFSLALLAAGAPADLIELAHRAALDEVRHAELCFGLATAYAGERVAPGPFPVGSCVDVDASLKGLAASAVREGCVGETVAAIVAAEQLARATDPAVRAALARIADDEARHAELAWRTVAWAVEEGGPETREAVATAFREALASVSTGARVEERSKVGSATMEAHGRLDAATTAEVVAAAMARVVGPSARALIERCRPLDMGEQRAS